MFSLLWKIAEKIKFYLEAIEGLKEFCKGIVPLKRFNHKYGIFKNLYKDPHTITYMYLDNILLFEKEVRSF